MSGYRKNKYQGPTSAYGRNEGVWVPEIGKGVNFETGVSIAALIIRDFLRGFTYDSSGKKIPMDEDLFRHRLFYLVALCHKHLRDKEECDRLHDVLRYAYNTLKLPRGVTVYLAGPNASLVARWLESKGIAPNVVVLGGEVPAKRIRVRARERILISR